MSDPAVKPPVIGTVGELRKLLATCEDDEPLTCYLDGEPRVTMTLGGASSAAGGRAVTLWFDRAK
jgi:hypothetical protein